MDWQAYLIGGLIAAFSLWQLVPLVAARRARGRSVPQLLTVLEERQKQLPRLLVYFHSARCGMCQIMTPVVERVAAGRDDVVLIDVGAAPGLARDLGVMATPSIAVVEKGVVSRVLVGARTEARIRALLEG